ncbi:hypothetical protein EG329_011954 [Mollisiaceae sp. DMI_Dod_QoI]|nr:hypothetical protein EG329_011954 [Helotiales sp. DMI_Dod_QoI]
MSSKLPQGRSGRYVGPERLDGYPTLANFIAQDQDAAIYRKFDRLSARTILYKQSELFELEARLDAFDKIDVTGDAATRNAARSWKKFWYNGNQRDQERRALMSKIREAIKEYHEMLLLQSEIHKLERPSSRTITNLRDWFHANNVPVLGGLDKTLLDDNFTEDLVALAPVDTDRLNIFLQNNFGYLLRAHKMQHLFAPELELKRRRYKKKDVN